MFDIGLFEFVTIAVVALLAWWVLRKGRPFAAGSVFRASRLSSGNHLFPTQVLITSTSVVQYTPRWVGKSEETIHLQHVASVRIDTGAFFSNVMIETSGGTDPILCHGHAKKDAEALADFDAAVALNPDAWRAVHNRGVSYAAHLTPSPFPPRGGEGSTLMIRRSSW